MRPLVFLADASAASGLGHLMRCMALAQAAESAAIGVLFLLSEEGAALARERHDWHFPIEIIDAGASPDWLKESLNRCDAAALVVDSYHTEPDLLQQADQVVRVIMDDGQLTLAAFADIIVNPATTTLDATYLEANADVTCCTGEPWRLIRREFWQISSPPVEERNGIVISMGGSDPGNLTVPLLRALEQAGNDEPVRVITGAAYPFTDELKEMLTSVSFPVQHIHNCQDMAQVWPFARLAIGAAGGSQFELGLCQTPAMLITVADNQVAATANAIKEGWCKAWHSPDARDIEALVSESMALVKDTAALERMSRAAQGHYDAGGAHRLLEVIADALHP